MKTAILKSLLLALALVALVPTADAARPDPRKREQKEAKTENLYPNSKREEPRVPGSSSAYKSLQKGFDLLGKDQEAEAKPFLEEVIANKKATTYEQAQALRGLAQITVNAGETAAAVDYAQRAVDLNALDNASQFDTLYLIAQININDQQYENALVAIDRWFKDSGAEKADAYALKGNALYRLERYPEAAEVLKKAIAMSDNPSDSWSQMLTASYQESGNTEGAIKLGEEALAKDPNNKQATLQLAQAYVDADPPQNDKAAAVLDAAYKKGVLDDEKALVYLANLYYEMDKPVDAATVLAGAITAGKVKGDETNYTRLGNYWYEAKKVDEAIAAYGKGAEQSTTGELDYQRGYLLMQEKENLTDGRKAIQQGLAKGGLKHEGEAHIMLGNAANEEGNCKDAKAEYQKAATFPATKSMADQMLKNTRC